MTSENEGAMPEANLLYRAFLVRLRRDGPDAPWRASVEFPGEPQLRHFPDLDALCRFLRDEAGEAARPSRARPADDGC